MKIKLFKILAFLFLCCNSTLFSQDLLNKLDKELTNTTLPEIATFKTTRIAMLQSVETRKKGALELSVYNRYWNVPNTNEQNFLADRVCRRFGLNYAFTDNFTLGFGHANMDGVSDAYFKFKVLKQQQHGKKMPVTFTFLQNFSYRKVKEAQIAIFGNNLNDYMLASSTQFLVARKMNQHLSLQVAPTLITRFINNTSNNPNTQIAVVVAGRYKISGHASVVSEYYYIANPLKNAVTYPPFLVGLNWEIGDLMLQFHATNARNFPEDTYITQTRNNFNFKDPNFHFGFNATLLLHSRKRALK